jgi:SAM-dependent methyltransferase
MSAEFRSVLTSPKWSGELHRFLEVIFHLFPEDKFHALIASASQANVTDEAVYKQVLKGLPSIKPFLSELTVALPALRKQKKEMARQVLQLLGGRKRVDGYLEIGSTGRYIAELRRHIDLSGRVFLTNDIAPNNSIADIMERGQFGKIGTFLPLTYQPIGEREIASGSIDLVTCHIGLHHCPLERLDGYVGSINRILRKGGLFVMRDHDVRTPEMAIFVSLVHTVFNLGLKVDWATNNAEFRSFRSMDEWSRLVSAQGFTEQGVRILQDRDPSDNTLVAFLKA